jgi:hypothetical protein
LNRFVIQQAVELSMITNNVPCLLGYTGVGKSDMADIIAKRHNRTLITLNLAVQSTEDLVGYPYRNEQDNKMYWAPPSWFPEVENQYIIFADEINRASKDVINAIMPMLLNGSLHEHTLPKGTWLMAAMNPDNDDFDMVYSFDDAAIISRLIFIETPPEFASWQQWLKNKNMYDETIVEFLKKNPDMFVPEIKNVMSQNIRPNPRSWTKFINILHYCKTNKIKPLDALDLISRGLLGEKPTVYLAPMLDTYFEDMNLKTLFMEDLNDDNAMSISNAIIQNLNLQNNITDIADCASWFLRNAYTHPTIIKRILLDTDSGLDELYKYEDFCKAVSYITSH